MQIPAIYWSYKTASHAAELTAGYYNPSNRDGYSPVFETLKKYSVTVKFVCPGPQMSSNEHEEALADPEGLSWQVMAVFIDDFAFLFVFFSLTEALLYVAGGQCSLG